MCNYPVVSKQRYLCNCTVQYEHVHFVGWEENGLFENFNRVIGAVPSFRETERKHDSPVWFTFNPPRPVTLKSNILADSQKTITCQTVHHAILVIGLKTTPDSGCTRITLILAQFFSLSSAQVSCFLFPVLSARNFVCRLIYCTVRKL